MYYLLPAYTYLFFSILCAVIFLAKRKSVKKLNSKIEGISVVVAARNEEQFILPLLESIFKNTFCPIEVVVVDDHSDDATFELLSNYSNQNLKVIKGKGEGKKSAIEQGVKTAKHELILQTDADSLVGENWVESMLLVLSDKKLVLGPVFPFRNKSSFLQSLIKVEFAGLQLLTGATSFLKIPIMANGANMGFYKKDYIDFIEKGDGKSFASGDDQFYLSFIKQRFGAKAITYSNVPDSVVESNTPNTYGQLLTQRKRWLSKMGGVSDLPTTAIGLLILVLNLSVVVTGMSALLLPEFKVIFWTVLSIKFLGEGILSVTGLSFFNSLKTLPFVPVLFVLYPFHLLLVIMKGKGNYQWKKRIVQ